jgi:membrane protease YdiL (CAAX protease family)
VADPWSEKWPVHGSDNTVPSLVRLSVTMDVDTTQLPSRRRLRAEILIVLGLSLGKSAIYAIVKLAERYAAETPVRDQATTINPSRSGIDVFDLIYQVLSIAFALVPVALVIYLLGSHGTRATRILGLVGPARAWWRDIGLGAILAACIGLPGLGLYFVGRAIGQNVSIDTSGLPGSWWASTILLLAAATAAILEETIVVGYLVTRLEQLKWSVPAIIITSALIRGGYHLYQGWPMALGNVVMGAVFAWVFIRRRRLAPLIVAHFLLDFVSFVGPEVLPDEWLAALDLA